jgi:tetratricopeptide (TPR) repeat protein
VRRRAILAAAPGALALSGRAEAQARPRIGVMLFENVARDSRIFLADRGRRGAARGQPQRAGRQRDHARRAARRVRAIAEPPAAVLTDATVIRIGQLVGASHVIVGSLQLKGETLLIRAKSIALEAGRIQTSATQGGPLPELFSIFERMGREFAPPGTASSFSGNPPDNPPVRAFENYIKGLLAETPATAINYLNAALKGYPSFDRSRLALWEVYTDQGDHERALAAVKAIPVSAPFGRRASFLAALSQLTMKRFEEAFRLFTVLLKERPTAAVYNNLGVVQLRRGASAETGTATYYFNRAAEMAALMSITSSISATPIGCSATSRPLRTGFAKPCGAIRPTATRTWCSPRRLVGGADPRSYP